MFFETCDLFFANALESSKLAREDSISDEESDNDTGEMSGDTVSSSMYRPRRNSSLIAIPKHNHYGSFYLRMGAVGNLVLFISKKSLLTICLQLLG